MNYKPLVSIVIPVYNAEKYVRNSIACVLNQTYQNIEAIYVCDGCSDTSVSILREYADSPKIKIINRPNNIGAAMSRNEGIQIASGEWAIFWDVDDFVKESAIETMLKQAILYNADMAICAYGTLGEEHCSLNMKFNYLKERIETYPVMEINNKHIFDLSNQIVCNAPYNKLIKMGLLKAGNVYFQNIKNCNDVYFSVSAFLNSKRVVYIDDKLYWYRKDTVGSISSKRIAVKSYILEALSQVRELMLKMNYNESIFKQYARIEIIHYRSEKVFNQICEEYHLEYENKWGISIDNHILYSFTEKNIIKDKEVIIFGAGNVGKDYTIDICKNSKVVCCMDSKNNDNNIKPVNEIINYEYDYVIIATISDYNAEIMYNTLLNLGVDKDKILLRYPQYSNIVGNEI